jgi:hypothetical protein
VSRIFIPTAVPAELASDANHLAMCHGESAADGQTWTCPAWQDAAGNAYVLRHLWATEWWADHIAASAPAAPGWDTGGIVDTDAATRARDALLVLRFDPEADPAQYAARPDRNVMLLGVSGDAAIALLGLSPIPEA